MYFDNCSTLEQMVQVREELYDTINKEFSNKSRQLKRIKKEHIDKFIFNMSKKEMKQIMFMAFPINESKGKKNEVIFNSDGSVTI